MLAVPIGPYPLLAGRTSDETISGHRLHDKVAANRVVLGVAEQALEADPEPLNAESVLAAADRVFWQISGKWRSERREKMRCAWWS